MWAAGELGRAAQVVAFSAVDAVPPQSRALPDDDEDDLVACYRHPDQLTALHCISCDRPICIDCAVMGSVGQKCPDCARLPRAARATIPASAFVRSGLVALVLGAAAGYVYAIIPLPIIGWIIAGIAGGAIGDLARRAGGGFRHPVQSRLVAALVALGFAWPVFANLVLGSSVQGGTLLSLVGAGFAAYAAYQRS